MAEPNLEPNIEDKETIHRLKLLLANFVDLMLESTHAESPESVDALLLSKVDEAMYAARRIRMEYGALRRAVQEALVLDRKSMREFTTAYFGKNYQSGETAVGKMLADALYFPPILVEVK